MIVTRQLYRNNCIYLLCARCARYNAKPIYLLKSHFLLPICNQENYTIELSVRQDYYQLLFEERCGFVAIIYKSLRCDNKLFPLQDC